MNLKGDLGDLGEVGLKGDLGPSRKFDSSRIGDSASVSGCGFVFPRAISIVVSGPPVVCDVGAAGRSFDSPRLPRISFCLECTALGT